MDKTRVAAVHGSGDMVLVMVNMYHVAKCVGAMLQNCLQITLVQNCLQYGAKLSAIWCNIECKVTLVQDDAVRQVGY